MLEQLVARRDPAVRELRQRRQRLLANPSDPGEAAAYARQAIAIGRAQSDPRYFGYAASALAFWRDRTPPDEIDWLQAVLQQQRHDFAGAEAALDALLARSAYTPAYLTRATMRIVQGRPQDALADCAALTRAALVTATACAASARSLTGKGASALASIDAIVPRLREAAPDERLWVITMGAEIATRLERWDDTQARFDAALEQAGRSATQDPYLLTAYADFLLARDRPAEVVELLRDQQRVDAALLRLALAEQAVGDANLPVHVRELQARFAAVRARGETTHGREEALFALQLEHDAVKALGLAETNWQLQREPIDARLLLQAAISAKRPEAARPVIDWMQQTGIEDPGLHRLAGPVGAGR